MSTPHDAIPTFIGLAAVALLAPFASGQQFKDKTATQFPVPNPVDYTNYVEVGDIDGDGDLDLVFANGGNFSTPGANQPVRAFMNNGAAFFTDESVARIGVSGLFRGVALGDADCDGDLDMLLASDFNRQPRLLINNGLGFYTDGTAARLPVILLSSTRGQFGDIDNDGDLDIYINHGGATNRFGCGLNRIFINDGAGFYTDGTIGRHPLGNVCQPMDVIFGDVDNDFDLDVRTANRGTNNSKLYLNDGTGVFTQVTSGIPADSECYSYDFGDLDGDGFLDLCGANAGPANQELLLKGVGNGTFTNVSGQLSPNPSADDNDSKFLDLDNDGDLDLIIGALFQGAEKIYRNNGAGFFTLDASLISAVSDATLDVMVADFDGDDKLDIVTGQGESGNFQNRLYINSTGNADTRAPSVERTEVQPDICDTDGPYVVRAAVFDDVTSDRGFFDAGVVLVYTVDAGAPNDLDMKWSGNSIWRVEIPGQPGGSVVEYFVRATDPAGNVGTGPATSFTILAGAADLDGDGNIGFTDLNLLLAVWGKCVGCPEDLDDNDSVGFTDLNLLLEDWGTAGCP